jgi:hypothetical protein
VWNAVLQLEVSTAQHGTLSGAGYLHQSRREIGAMFDPAFTAHGVQTPQPIDGERPGRFRRRLYDHLRRKLPGGHDLAGVRADDLPTGPAFVHFKAQVIEAAQQEGEKPSFENLPDDGMVMRTRTDANTGTKFNEFFGKRSYIADMGRKGRRVAAIIDRNSGNCIWGTPLRQAR